MLFLDTHVLIWLMEGKPHLGKQALSRINDALTKGQLALSCYVFWEMAMLQKKKRLPLDKPLLPWRRAVLDFGVVEVPLTGLIAIESTLLENFHHDPADRIMVATAMHHQAPLLTADKEILRWRGGVKCLDAQK